MRQDRMVLAVWIVFAVVVLAATAAIVAGIWLVAMWLIAQAFEALT